MIWGTSVMIIHLINLISKIYQNEKQIINNGLKVGPNRLIQLVRPGNRAKFSPINLLKLLVGQNRKNRIVPFKTVSTKKLESIL